MLLFYISEAYEAEFQATPVQNGVGGVPDSFINAGNVQVGVDSEILLFWQFEDN